MDKKMFVLIITLVIIGILSALSLAFVYQWTIPQIEEHQRQAREKALFEVLPGAVSFSEIKKNDTLFYKGYDQLKQLIGVACIVSGGGFQGEITIIVGTDPLQEKILRISILQHQETPGLGARITEEDFLDNFAGKPFGSYHSTNREPVDDYEIEAISGATVSVNSVIEIVETAVRAVNQYYGGDFVETNSQ